MPMLARLEAIPPEAEVVVDTAAAAVAVEMGFVVVG